MILWLRIGRHLVYVMTQNHGIKLLLCPDGLKQSILATANMGASGIDGQVWMINEHPAQCISPYALDK